MAKYNFELKKKIVLEHLSLGVGSKDGTRQNSSFVGNRKGSYRKRV